VANLEDSKAPNFLIRAIIRGKNEKYETNILTDPDHSLPKAWGLGDCNNQSIVVIIDQTKTVRLVQRGAVRGADIEKIISLVEQLTGERDARSVLSAEAGAQP
jgi:predicted transcriptional regulator